MRRCLAGDTLVLTREGEVAIKDVNVGDEVMSIDGSYHKVVSHLKQGYARTFVITYFNAGYFYNIRATEEHEFMDDSIVCPLDGRDAKKGEIEKNKDKSWVRVSELFMRDQDNKACEEEHPVIKLSGISQCVKDNASAPFVVGIREGIDEIVYDMALEGDMPFVVQGLLTHNCSN